MGTTTQNERRDRQESTKLSFGNRKIAVTPIVHGWKRLEDAGHTKRRGDANTISMELQMLRENGTVSHEWHTMQTSGHTRWLSGIHKEAKVTKLGTCSCTCCCCVIFHECCVCSGVCC
jgi:hypothetical protein